MLYELLVPLAKGGDVFNLFRYITFRAGGAFFTALLFGFLFGRPIIDRLRASQGKGQPIREDGPQSHLLEKKGAPTMGGVMILAAVLFSTLIWGRLDNGYVLLGLFVTFGFGAIGFADDFAIPACTSCGGIVKPAVTFFGGSVPKSDVARAADAVASADALLVVGSSLHVFSAFRLARAAHASGTPVAILNNGPT